MSKKENDNENESMDLSIVLGKLAKGSILIFISTSVGYLFTFITRILIGRVYGVDTYGLFSLVIALLNIFVIISSLGLPSGVARQISYQLAKKNTLKVSKFITSSIFLNLISCTLILLVLLAMSKEIAIIIFKDSRLLLLLKILAITLPFSAFINLYSSILRGFGKVTGVVYFQQFIRRSILLLLICLTIALNLNEIYIFYFLSLSFILTWIIFTIYLLQNIRINFLSIDLKTSIDLLRFSIPLLGSSMLGMIITWTDTIMLGYFKTSIEVGLYNSATTLSRLISIVIPSLSYLYLPFITELHAEERKKEIEKMFSIISKWIFCISFPIFVILFLFPDVVISMLFGSEFTNASNVLRILSVGMLIYTFLGLSGPTLITIGKTNLHLINDLTGAILNVILNAILIPIFGITGAAIASTISFITISFLMLIQVHLNYGIHPLGHNNIKTIIILSLCATMIYIAIFSIINLYKNIQNILIFFILFLLISLVVIILTKSIEKSEKKLISLIIRILTKKR